MHEVFVPKLIIAQIKEGTVIDHIPCDKALFLIELLDLGHHPHPLSMATWLESKKMGKKAILKISHRFITETEELKISLMAPSATLSWIESSQVIKKKSASIPKEILGIFPCSNPHCIGSHEPSFCHFFTETKRKEVIVTCSFCKEAVPLAKIIGGPRGQSHHRKRP